MSELPANDFGFDENDYARPNQPWVCGWAADGNACPLGPTKRGGCRSAFECVPYRDSDTWTCARIRSHGGACEEGPLPDGTCCRPIPKCSPVASLMARRRLLSFCVFALAIGVVLIMIASPGREEIVSPGPLNSNHSTIVQGCADCHDVGKGKLSNWIHSALDDEAAAKQDELCLRCHAELKSFSDQPHGVSYLDEISIRIGKKELRDGNLQKSKPLLVTAAKSIEHGSLACATCHHEHHGASHDLETMTNNQCQVCHKETFSSLTAGHPEFLHYPYERRTRIYFDHESHYGAHFQTLDGEISCGKCHEPDATRKNMLVRGFDDACASCHAEQIEDDLTPGFNLFAVPALDTETLTPDRIGHWPIVYPNHVAMSDSYWDHDYADLADLRDATDEQLKTAESFVWMFKEHLADIVQNGHIAVPKGQRSFFPVESLRLLAKTWFPNIVAEVEAHKNSEPLPRANTPPMSINQRLTRERTIDRTVANGWYVRDVDLSLRYRPTGHADPIMRHLIEFQVATAGDETPSVSPFDSGRCLKCHSVERGVYDDEHDRHETRVHWLAKQPLTTRRPFTFFDHGPHLTLMTNEACLKCHAMKTDTPRASLFRPEYFDGELQIDTDRHQFDVNSNFAHIPKSNCAQCHTPSGAGNRCLSCHNYHIQ